MPKKKKSHKTKAKSARKSISSAKTAANKARRTKKKAPAGELAEFQFRERRLCDIKRVDRHPAPETVRKYNDTLPLPFGGEVKKDAMRDHGLFH